MAFSSYRTRFQGTLAGINIKELDKLDYKLTTLKKRREYLEDKYERISPFYNTYIFTMEKDNPLANEEDKIEFYKVNVNINDELSAEINIFKSCERDANYLLNSSDVSRDKQQQYKILSEEEFKKLLYKERMNVPIDTPEVLEICKSAEQNHYKSNDIEIYSNDFKDETIKDVLMSYQVAINLLKAEMEKVKNKQGSCYDLGFLKRNLGSLKTDMIDSKKMLKGITNPAKKLGDESGMFYSEMIDYTNEEHIKAILKAIRFTGELEPENNLSHIAYDIELSIKALVDKKKLDDLDLEIIDCLNAGYSERAIAKELEKGSTTIQQRVKKIVKRIANYHKDKK